MRDAALLGARLLLGGYMGIHASQKLLGKFHGPGLEAIGKVFEDNGLAPGREMAMAAAATEIAGGVLTITGIADPAGPLAVAGAMAVAAALQPRARPDGGAQRRRAARRVRHPGAHPGRDRRGQVQDRPRRSPAGWPRSARSSAASPPARSSRRW